MDPISRKKILVDKQNYRVQRKHWRAEMDAEMAGIIIVTELRYRKQGGSEMLRVKSLDSTNSKNSREMKYLKTSPDLAIFRTLKSYY